MLFRINVHDHLWKSSAMGKYGGWGTVPLDRFHTGDLRISSVFLIGAITVEQLLRFH